MTRTYVIKKNDTLGRIAKQNYGDASLANLLARYNGILDASHIFPGQTIEVPSMKDLGQPEKLAAAVVTPAPSGLTPPNGLDQVLATFGNIYDYLAADGSLRPQWEIKYLTRAPLPFPLALSWDPSKKVSQIYCHVRLQEIFPAVFAGIQKEGLAAQVRTYGGCFNFRSKRTSGKLSTHSWGIAVDLNPETNLQGSKGKMHPDVVEIFRSFGFKWGGDWPDKTMDPMHFQFCTGY